MQHACQPLLRLDQIPAEEYGVHPSQFNQKAAQYGLICAAAAIDSAAGYPSPKKLPHIVPPEMEGSIQLESPQPPAGDAACLINEQPAPCPGVGDGLHAASSLTYMAHL
jgi:hypothetical protein